MPTRLTCVCGNSLFLEACLSFVLLGPDTRLEHYGAWIILAVGGAGSSNQYDPNSSPRRLRHSHLGAFVHRHFLYEVGT